MRDAIAAIRLAIIAPLGASEWFMKSAKAFGYTEIFWLPDHDAVPEGLSKLQENGFTHALWTDSDDALFVATKQRLLGNYGLKDFPPVLFGIFQGNPNAGQYMGRIDALLTMWDAVNSRYKGTAQERMDLAWRDKVNIVGDSEGAVFRTNAATYNPKKWDACLLHFNTGTELMGDICRRVIGGA